jgi:hypothetical protein
MALTAASSPSNFSGELAGTKTESVAVSKSNAIRPLAAFRVKQ